MNPCKDYAMHLEALVMHDANAKGSDLALVHTDSREGGEDCKMSFAKTCRTVASVPEQHPNLVWRTDWYYSNDLIRASLNLSIP